MMSLATEAIGAEINRKRAPRVAPLFASPVLFRLASHRWRCRVFVEVWHRAQREVSYRASLDLLISKIRRPEAPETSCRIAAFGRPSLSKTRQPAYDRDWGANL
jgi:hypothetical protein